MTLISIRTPRALRGVQPLRQVIERPAGSAAARRRRTSARSFPARIASSRSSVQSATRAALSSDIFAARLVVLAVVPLDAVVAREVALQRRQHGDAELVLALAHVVEELLEVLPLGLAVAARGSPARRASRAPRAPPRSVSTACATRPGRAAPRRRAMTISCASVNVFIRNTSSLRLPFERNTNVEHRGLHANSCDGSVVTKSVARPRGGFALSAVRAVQSKVQRLFRQGQDV